jgi:hypothetical protein
MLMVLDVTCETLRQMQEQSIPTDLSYAEYIRENMHVVNDGYEPYSTDELAWFVEFLYEETHRVARMRDPSCSIAI